MRDEARSIVVDVARHLVTVNVASIGFLVTLLFTTFQGTPFVASALTALFALLLSAVFAILAQLAVVEDVLGSPSLIRWLHWSPRTLLVLAWMFLIAGVTAFVVFTWASVGAS